MAKVNDNTVTAVNFHQVIAVPVNSKTHFFLILNIPDKPQFRSHVYLLIAIFCHWSADVIYSCHGNMTYGDL